MPVASPFSTSGGGSITLEHDDISSQCNGSAQSFTVSSNYQSGSLQVYWNGLLQLSLDIVETSLNTFSTSFTPSSDDHLVVIYTASI
jgi:hypothetical protein